MSRHALRLLLIAIGLVIPVAWSARALPPPNPKQGPHPPPTRLFAFLRLLRSGIEVALGLRFTLLPASPLGGFGNY